MMLQQTRHKVFLCHLPNRARREDVCCALSGGKLEPFWSYTPSVLSGRDTKKKSKCAPTLGTFGVSSEVAILYLYIDMYIHVYTRIYIYIYDHNSTSIE